MGALAGSGDIRREVEQAAVRGDVRLLAGLLEEQPLEVRLEAVEALGSIRGAGATLALLGIARDRWGQRPEVRIAALDQLSAEGPERYTEILSEFIDGDNRKVVAAARRRCLSVDPDGLPRRLVERGSVDAAAIRLYGDAAEEEAVGLLSRFLRERVEAGDVAAARYWGKVYGAVRALRKIGGEESEAAIAALAGWLDGAGAGGPGSLKAERLAKIRAAVAGGAGG